MPEKISPIYAKLADQSIRKRGLYQDEEKKDQALTERRERQEKQHRKKDQNQQKDSPTGRLKKEQSRDKGKDKDKNYARISLISKEANKFLQIFQKALHQREKISEQAEETKKDL